MKILPASVEEQINRVDPQRSLLIGIGLALVAAWSFFRVIWMLYVSMAFGLFLGPLIFNFVLWGVIGSVAAVGAFGFLTRYRKGSST